MECGLSSAATRESPTPWPSSSGCCSATYFGPRLGRRGGAGRARYTVGGHRHGADFRDRVWHARDLCETRLRVGTRHGADSRVSISPCRDWDDRPRACARTESTEVPPQPAPHSLRPRRNRLHGSVTYLLHRLEVSARVARRADRVHLPEPGRGGGLAISPSRRL